MPRRRDAARPLQNVTKQALGRSDARANDDSVAANVSHCAFSGMSKYDGLQELYVDRLLATSEKTGEIGAQSPSLQDLGVFGMYMESLPQLV